ncbi:hypothetical protein BGX24_003506 [Mortierella sp. AD032]|nr:hypothetical protein BGX24_003506 [Mortierella sp. AD032]
MPSPASPSCPPPEELSSIAPNLQGHTSLSKRAKHTIWEKGRAMQSGTYKIQEDDQGSPARNPQIKGTYLAKPHNRLGLEINIQMLRGSGYYPGSMPEDLWDRHMKDLKYYMAERGFLGKNSVWFQVWGESGHEALCSVEVMPSDVRQG